MPRKVFQLEHFSGLAALSFCAAKGLGMDTAGSADARHGCRGARRPGFIQCRFWRRRYKEIAWKDRLVARALIYSGSQIVCGPAIFGGHPQPGKVESEKRISFTVRPLSSAPDHTAPGCPATAAHLPQAGGRTRTLETALADRILANSTHLQWTGDRSRKGTFSRHERNRKKGKRLLQSNS